MASVAEENAHQDRSNSWGAHLRKAFTQLGLVSYSNVCSTIALVPGEFHLIHRSNAFLSEPKWILDGTERTVTVFCATISLGFRVTKYPMRQIPRLLASACTTPSTGHGIDSTGCLPELSPPPTDNDGGKTSTSKDDGQLTKVMREMAEKRLDEFRWMIYNDTRSAPHRFLPPTAILLEVTVKTLLDQWVLLTDAKTSLEALTQQYKYLHPHVDALWAVCEELCSEFSVMVAQKKQEQREKNAKRARERRRQKLEAEAEALASTAVEMHEQTDLANAMGAGNRDVGEASSDEFTPRPSHFILHNATLTKAHSDARSRNASPIPWFAKTEVDCHGATLATHSKTLSAFYQCM
ncbi:hypothetical protein BXZ70DRAFT_911566 [Cristinia sonorae]|uniref:Uncharacterized protein n=1 Tax=Cristinia sonorae TaxID=1940300 RepID=A0A8K0UCM9_9AGAR|nr:hypothetical protein BXZ70DRAFT_911566 [Cristinia sonorae]